MTVINSYDKPAGEIQRGNYLFGQKVLGNDIKRVNCVIRLADEVAGRTAWTFKLTDLLEVGVEELTDEEKAERVAEAQREREEHFVKTVRDYVTKAQNDLLKAQALRTKRTEDGWGHLDYGTIQAELSAWASADLAREVDALFSAFEEGTFHHHPELGACEYTERTDTGRACVKKGNATELDVAKNVVERMKKRLVSSAMQTRSLSRSTSTISNLCDDLKLEAVAEFLNSLQYASYGVVEIPARY